MRSVAFFHLVSEVKFSLEYLFKFINVDLTVPIHIEDIENWVDILLSQYFLSIQWSCQELLIIYLAIFVDVYRIKEIFPVNLFSSPLSKYFGHALFKLN